MSKAVKAGLLDAAGFISAMAVPLGTIYYNFRGEFTAELAWYEKVGISAGVMGLCIIISILTLWKYISPRIKSNPDLWAMPLLLSWGVMAGIIFLIYAIINKILAVAVAGLIGAFIACLFNGASYCIKHYGKDDKA